MTVITICGGGSLAHVCAGMLSSQPGVTVNIFTQQPDRWSHQLEITDPDGKVVRGKLDTISSNPAEALDGAQIILLCLPGFAIDSTLEKIKPHIGDAVVGSIVCSTGFFFSAHRILGENARLFGFQRVPYIARTVEYGHSANLLGYKPQLAIAVENVSNVDNFRKLSETLWNTPVKLLGSHFEASLTNSNPILHTSRLYTMWKDWNGQACKSNTLFYRDWTVEASQMLIDMDAEFMQLLDVLPVTNGAIPSVLEYYESHDAESLTRKISGIPAFQNIASPMIQNPDGWVPDFKSRYFTEDFPYGLAIIRRLAHEKEIECPNIDKVYDWGISMIQN